MGTKARRTVGAVDNRTMGEKVDEYLVENPTFVDLCARFTHDFLRNTGSEHVSIQAVLERVRWERSIQTRTADYKINNSFASYLSRLVMATHPELDGVYETRRADDADEWLARRPEVSGSLFDLFDTVPAQRRKAPSEVRR